MDTDHETRPPGGPPPPGYRPPLGGLTRATDDTVISGLCGGLGRHFGIDPLVFRIAFVVMSLAGGTGILLYLVGWALVPDDQGKTFGMDWLPGKDRSHKLLAAALAGIGVLVLIDRITDGHGDDVPLGLVLIGLGAAVLWSRRGGQSPTISPPPPPVPPPPPPPPGPPAEPVIGSETDATTTSEATTPPEAGSSASWAAGLPLLPPPPLPPL
ncbi:MAG TPA: PspC domain-containing protein, partial [Acidimicrobiales bacterium]